MYSLLSEFSQLVSNPLSVYLHNFNHSPLISAFLLGLIGSMAPCQLTGNISTITLYGSRTVQLKEIKGEVLAFLLGKVITYSLIGFFAWMFGQAFETVITAYFPLFRKAIGPLLILTGLVMLGLIKLRFLTSFSVFEKYFTNKGKANSFLLGICFSIAFCPTMFVLYFVWLMPLVISSPAGLVLPGIFAIATSLPLLLILWLLAQFKKRKSIMQKSMAIGKAVQKIAGILIILFGILDTIMYWGI